MNSSHSATFGYWVFKQGQEAMLLPEDDCPYPKVRLPGREKISQSIADALGDHPLPTRGREHTVKSAAFNFEMIASDDLFPDRQVCGYHLARALASLVVELFTGEFGEVYGDFSPVLHELIEEWTSSRPDVTEMAHSVLQPLLDSASAGGLRGFVETVNEIERELFKRKRRWLFV